MLQRTNLPSRVSRDEADAAVGKPLSSPIGHPWRVFIRALAGEVDAQGGEAARDELLRGVGRRMAKLMPLPEVTSVESLEIEMNDMLSLLAWGSTRLTLEENENSLTIIHSGLPRLGAAGNPPGLWLSAVLEGLYETWIAQQPGSDPQLFARRSAITPEETIVLRYGKD